MLVAPALLAAEPFGVEIVANAVGGRFNSYESVRFEGNAAADCLHESLGRTLRRRGPESCLAQVGHGIVGAAHGVLVLARPYGHAAAAPCDLPHVYGTLVGLELWFLVAIPQLFGIIVEKFGIHAADSRGGVFYMCAYQRVPVVAVARLNPRHIHLHQCRAAPLAGLEQYQAQRLAGQAVGFEYRGDPTLRSVEYEWAFFAGSLVFDSHALGAPVFEVVPAAEALPCTFVEVGAIVGVGFHARRHQHLPVAVVKHRHSLANAACACAGVIVSVAAAAPQVVEYQLCGEHGLKISESE